MPNYPSKQAREIFLTAIGDEFVIYPENPYHENPDLISDLLNEFDNNDLLKIVKTGKVLDKRDSRGSSEVLVYTLESADRQIHIEFCIPWGPPTPPCVWILEIITYS